MFPAIIHHQTVDSAAVAAIESEEQEEICEVLNSYLRLLSWIAGGEALLSLLASWVVRLIMLPWFSWAGLIILSLLLAGSVCMPVLAGTFIVEMCAARGRVPLRGDAYRVFPLSA